MEIRIGNDLVSEIRIGSTLLSNTALGEIIRQTNTNSNSTK